MRADGSPHKSLKGSPQKRRTPRRGIASDRDNGGSCWPSLLPSLTFLMCVLFLLSLVTMALFYSQLQLAEEEIGEMVIPYVKHLLDRGPQPTNPHVGNLSRNIDILKKIRQSPNEVPATPGSSITPPALAIPAPIVSAPPPPVVTAAPTDGKVVPVVPPPAPAGIVDPHPDFVAPVHKTLQCDHLKLVSYWQQPSEKDWHFKTEFMRAADARRAQEAALPPEGQGGPGREQRYYDFDEKYVTFEPDKGGWNNIRMQMELVIVYALVSGRTLVIPADQPMYLLMSGKGAENVHSFDDYFPFDWIGTRMKVITMNEFLRREGVTGRLYQQNTTRNAPDYKEGAPAPHKVLYPPRNRTTHNCGHRETRWALFDYLRAVGALPKFKAYKEFVAFPHTSNYNYTAELIKGNSNSVEYRRAKDISQRKKVFAGERTAKYYNRYWQKQKVIHFISQPEMGYRLLDHFYSFIFFEDEAVDHFVKRFVRDHVHYLHLLFCKAAIIVNALLDESQGGGYSAFHVRRGDLQYKEVKVNSSVLLANTLETHKIKEGQLIYIATDVKEREYFDDMKVAFPNLRFLFDYADDVGLKRLNPNYLGMLDQIVCTHADVFVGTWFSTFTGYIIRLRGYLGYADDSNLFGDKSHRDRMQVPELMKFPYYMREWNESWWHINDDQHTFHE